MRLTLAVSDLLAQDHAALAYQPSLRKLAHYAGVPSTRPGSLDAFLLAGAEASGIAPLAARGAGFDPGSRYTLRADPVSLVAGRNDVVLATRIDDLDADDADALRATLNTHFEHDGLTFRTPRPDAWFVVADPEPDLHTSPLAAVRGAILPFLPGGGDSVRWRRWMSEMQMLLHDHPANVARTARGREAVTGIWIADGGRLADISASPFPVVYATQLRSGDVARGLSLMHGSTARGLPADMAGLPTQDDATVVLDAADVSDASAFDKLWLGPAIAALERGSLSALTVILDGNGVAAAWHTQRPAWTRRALARLSASAFVPPSFDADDA